MFSSCFFFLVWILSVDLSSSSVILPSVTYSLLLIMLNKFFNSHVFHFQDQHLVFFVMSVLEFPIIHFFHQKGRKRGVNDGGIEEREKREKEEWKKGRKREEKQSLLLRHELLEMKD